jgi:putative PIN family toxin of toxin-antitoxin system
VERTVLDTSVLVSGFRSRRGPAYRVLSLVGTGRFEIAVSVALVLEYEEVLSRRTQLGEEQIEKVVAYFCSVARLQKVFYLWRPTLRDPDDDMVLELAVAARADSIVTFNRRDFAGADRHGIEILHPLGFLRSIGE